MKISIIENQNDCAFLCFVSINMILLLFHIFILIYIFVASDSSFVEFI